MCVCAIELSTGFGVLRQVTGGDPLPHTGMGAQCQVTGTGPPYQAGWFDCLYSVGEAHECCCLFILNGGSPRVLLFVYIQWGKPMSVVDCLYSMGETHECC